MHIRLLIAPLKRYLNKNRAFLLKVFLIFFLKSTCLTNCVLNAAWSIQNPRVNFKWNSNSYHMKAKKVRHRLKSHKKAMCTPACHIIYPQHLGLCIFCYHVIWKNGSKTVEIGCGHFFNLCFISLQSCIWNVPFVFI